MFGRRLNRPARGTNEKNNKIMTTEKFMAEPEAMKAELVEFAASEAISRLHRIGTRSSMRRASHLGDLLGCYRRGRIGASLLRHRISVANNWLP